tara:strand:- start:357 stop:791 length:435 start_codon:yes stop_codon:yes gene_type:complete
MASINGQCHCGNITFSLHTDKPVNAIVARACQCSFCRLHQTKNWSDPQGHAEVVVRDEQRLSRYRFGLEQIDFLVCAECGSYSGAVLEDAEGAWATLNLRLTDIVDQVAVEAKDYDDQSGDERARRRKDVWTPVTLRVGEVGGA